MVKSQGEMTPKPFGSCPVLNTYRGHDEADDTDDEDEEDGNADNCALHINYLTLD